ncbi:MAG: 5-formyltetrahydrofolate cyclo-ligase [Acidimicrobiales bacterium]
MNDSRIELRQRLMVARDSLESVAQREASEAVRGHLGSLLADLTPGTIAAYLSYGGELDLRRTIAGLVDVGWRVVIPVIRPAFTILFAPFAPGDPLVDNHYGIGEPTTEPVGRTDIDVVLVPGVGFDRGGQRIGHGAGYYDRFFAACEDEQHTPWRIGTCHDIQVTDLPPAEPWDVAMHTIVSPSEVILVDEPPMGTD